MRQRRGVFVAVALLLPGLLGSAVVPALDFHDCPPEGQGGDPALNRLKNRVHSPGEFEPMEFKF